MGMTTMIMMIMVLLLLPLMMMSPIKNADDLNNDFNAPTKLRR